MKNLEIEQIKEKIRIENLISEFLNLTPKGKNLWGVCPFHSDTNPSMSISLEKQIFKCFVCGMGGDIFKFISEYKKLSFKEAIVFLGEKAGIKVQSSFEKKYSQEDQTTFNILDQAMNFYSYYLKTNEGLQALAYAKKRGLENNIQQLFAIGYAPVEGLIKFLKAKNYSTMNLLKASLINQQEKPFFKNRLIFGIKDEDNKIVGFSGRDLSNQSQMKYINSAENTLFKKSSILYNYYNAKNNLDKEKHIYVNEGFMDVIAMYKAGFLNSIAIMGTSLTQNHISKLKNLKVILMLDNDKAGINATLKSIFILLQNQIPTFVVVNKKGKDPDEILQTLGKEELIKLATNYVPGIEFVFNLLIKQKPLNSPENINLFLKEFKKYLSLTDQITKDFYVKKLFELTSIEKETLKNQLIEKISLKKTFVAKEQKFLPKKIPIGKNYSFILLHSIMKKNKLIDLIEKDKIHISFFENLLYSIFNYYRNIRKGKKVNINKNELEEIRFKLFEIEKCGEYYVEPKEFKEIVNRTNYEYINFQIEANKVKLDNTIDHKNKIKVLENIKLLEIQKRKLRGKLDENEE